MDDILITVHDFDDLFVKLTLGLSALRKANITLKPLKFLGHIVDSNGIHVDFKKIEAISKLPVPKNVNHMRSFLGKCNYFNEFIERYSIIAAPLYEITKQDVKFEWTEEHQKAFDKLKSVLSKPPVLAHFRPEYETELITDASTIGIAWKLAQKNPNTDKWHPISYGSQKLKEPEKKYPVTELEALAVVTALKKNRQYLQGIPFKVVTDHKSLKALMSKKELPGRLARYCLVVAEFPELEIVHRPGTQIEDVDLLSRHPVEEPNSEIDEYLDDKLFLITDTNQVPSVDDYRFHQERDPKIKKIMEDIENGRNYTTHVIKNGVVFRQFEGRLVIELPQSLIENILYIHHDHPMSGHRDFVRTYERIRSRFYFDSMKSKTKEHVDTCIECLQRKRPPGLTYGLMQTYEPKPQICEKWFADYLGPFPRSDHGNRYVFVMV